MTQIPPPLLQPPHQQRASLLRLNPAQKPMSPLPHNMRRIIRVSRSAANLHAAHARMCRDLAGQIERFAGGSEHR
jgi:hypothetical protein